MRTDKFKGVMDFTNSQHCVIAEQGAVHGDAQWRWHNVTSPFHRLYYIQSGKIYIRDAHRTYSLMPGNVYLIRRNTWMDYYAEESFEKLYIHLNYYNDSGYDLLDGCKSVTRLPLGKDLIQGIEENFIGESILQQAKTLSCLYEVLAIAIEEIPEGFGALNKAPGNYSNLIREIVSVCHMTFSVEDMAAACNQSVSDFSRKFKKEVGLSPKKFLHNQIMEKGKMLLLTTDDSVKRIGLSLGFGDSLYFSRFFKKRSGLSPNMYRRSQIGQ